MWKLGAVLALCSLLAACSVPAPTPTPAPSMTTIALAVPVKEKAIAEEAETIFSDRLTALGIDNFTSSIGDDMRFSFVLPSSVASSDVNAVMHTAGRLEWLAWPETGSGVPNVGAAVPDGVAVLFDQSHITSVALTTENNASPQTPAVEIHLDAMAAEAFATYTASHVGQPGALALDGKILAAPVIQSPIAGGDLIISSPSMQEPGALSAAALAAILKSGPVPVGWTIR